MSGTLTTGPVAPATPPSAEEAMALRLYPSSSGAPETLLGSEGDERAARMFPSSAPKQPPRDPATLTTGENAAAGTPAQSEGQPPNVADVRPEHIKAAIPSEIAELRRTSPDARADALYGDTPHDAIAEAFKGAEGLSDDTRKAVATEFSRMARDLSLDDSDVRYVIQRRQELAAAPLDRDTGLKQTVELISREFGPDKVVDAFNGAAALARRDPRVARFIESTGLANDPKLVVILAKRAIAERGRGRLK